MSTHDSKSQLFKALNEISDWTSIVDHHQVEFLLRQIFKTTIIPSQSSGYFLTYEITFEKELDPVVKKCMLVLFHSGNRLETQNQLVANINNKLKEENYSANNTLIYGWNMSLDAVTEISDGLNCSNLGTEEDFRALIDHINPKGHLIAILRKSILTMATCPFNDHGPVSPEMFVGRSDLIDTILNGKGEGHVIPAGRKTGKTSLLFRLQYEIQTQGVLSRQYVPLYLDCSTYNGYMELTNRIKQKLMPKEYFQSRISLSLEDILNRKTALQGKKLLLLLDEMDPLADDEKAQSKTGQDFFNSVRAAASIGGVRVVISGFRNISNLKKHDTPFFNLCEFHKLYPLSTRETRMLISLPLMPLGIRLENTKAMIDRIQEKTNGHPSLIQFIGKELYRIRSGDTLTMAELNRIIDGTVLEKELLDYLDLNHPSFEKLICLLIAKDTPPIHKTSVLDLLEKHEIPATLDGLTSALDSLCMNNILEKKEAGYTFLYPIMSDVVLREYQPVLKTLIKETKNVAG